MIGFYIGGARSGKSSLAETDIARWQGPIHYIATAINSKSMQPRIALHRQQRQLQSKAWIVHEVALDLSGALLEIDQTNAYSKKAARQKTHYQKNAIIIDCLTLWLTNQLLDGACLKTQIRNLCQTVSQLQSHIVLVSTEVGQSLIPLDEMSQQFVSASGEMQQAIAAVADQVFFCQSGFATCLKNIPLKIDDRQ